MSMKKLGLVKNQNKYEFSLVTTLPRTMTFAEYQLLTPEEKQGEIIVSDFPVEVDEGDYVEVTADGVKTFGNLLNELFVLIDASKINGKSFIEMVHSSGTREIYDLYTISSNVIYLKTSRTTVGSYVNATMVLRDTDSTVPTITISGNGTVSYGDASSQVLSNGVTITLYYNKTQTLELGTLAENCMMPDGVTTVNDMLETSAEVLATGITITRYGKMRTLVVNGEFTVSTATVSGFANKLPEKDRPLVSLQLFGMARYNSKYFGMYGSLENTGNLVVFGIDDTSSGGYVYLTGTPELRFSITYMVA